MARDMDGELTNAMDDQTLQRVVRDLASAIEELEERVNQLESAADIPDDDPIERLEKRLKGRNPKRESLLDKMMSAENPSNENLPTGQRRLNKSFPGLFREDV